MTNIRNIIKENIQNCMAEQFYIEGKDKDYYFGKSELNDNLTVFYNNIGSEKVVQCLKNAVSHSIQKGFEMITERKYGLRCKSMVSSDLSFSAFMIPMGIIKCYWFDMGMDYNHEDETIVECQINYMPSGVLEEAIKNNPERWDVYKKYRNKISQQ